MDRRVALGLKARDIVFANCNDNNFRQPVARDQVPRTLAGYLGRG